MKNVSRHLFTQTLMSLALLVSAVYALGASDVATGLDDPSAHSMHSSSPVLHAQLRGDPGPMLHQREANQGRRLLNWCHDSWCADGQASPNLHVFREWWHIRVLGHSCRSKVSHRKACIQGVLVRVLSTTPHATEVSSRQF